MAEKENHSVDTAPRRLCRREVAARLNMSTSSVRRLEWNGLTPELDENGVWTFDPLEVQSVEARVQKQSKPSMLMAGADADAVRAAARRGRLAARVFRMFARQLALPQIVVATKQPPDVIRELYREWSTSLEEAEWARRAREL